MAEISFFFEGKTYKQKDLARFNETLIPVNGILYDGPTSLQVQPTGGRGLSCYLAAGRMFQHGYTYKNDSALLLTLSPNRTGSMRYDRIVIGLDIARQRTFKAYIKEGQAGGIIPELRRETYYKEYSPGYFMASAGIDSNSTLTSASFVDTRFDLDAMGELIEQGYQDPLEWQNIVSSLRIPFFEANLAYRKRYYPLPNNLWAYIGGTQLWATCVICDNEGKTLREYTLDYIPFLGIDPEYTAGSSFTIIGADANKLFYRGSLWTRQIYNGQYQTNSIYGTINYLADQPKTWPTIAQAPQRFQEKSTWELVKNFIQPAYTESWQNFSGSSTQLLNFSTAGYLKELLLYRNYQAFVGGSVRTCYNSWIEVTANHLIKGIEPYVPAGYENFILTVGDGGQSDVYYTDSAYLWLPHAYLITNKDVTADFGIYGYSGQKIYKASKALALVNGTYRAQYYVDAVSEASNRATAEVLPHTFTQGRSAIWKEPFGIILIVEKTYSQNIYDIYLYDSVGSWHFIGSSKIDTGSIDKDNYCFIGHDGTNDALTNYCVQLGKTKARGVYVIAGQKGLPSSGRVIANLTKGTSGKKIYADSGDDLACIAILRSGKQFDIRFGKVA